MSAVQRAVSPLSRNEQKYYGSVTLLFGTKFIVWDEIPMSHRFSVEALHLTLKDLMGNNIIMGGKNISLSGDLRQIGPVVKHGGPAETIDASIISSPLWKHVRRMRLTISQRDREDAAYAAFVRNIGVGTQPHVTTDDGVDAVPLTYVHSMPNIASERFVLGNTDYFEELINFVHPDILDADPTEFKARAILSSTNATIDTINAHVLDILPGDLLTAYSCDTVDPDATDDGMGFVAAADLHAIDVSGVPPHALDLKLNCMVMITRNLNFKQGLVNGQKAIVR